MVKKQRIKCPRCNSSNTKINPAYKTNRTGYKYFCNKCAKYFDKKQKLVHVKGYTRKYPKKAKRGKKS